MVNYNTELTVEKILGVEGIVIRKIPRESRTKWSDGREEVKVNSLGGKYLVTLKHNQDSIVRFTIGRDGVGETLQDAWRDLLLNGVYYLP